MQRTLRLAFIALALSALALLGSGCGGTNNVGSLGNFVMAFSGFGPHVGRDFYLKVVDLGANTTVGLSTPTAIASEGFSVSLNNIINSGRNYRIDFWVDVDDNGTLDRSPAGNPAGVDASWRRTATGTDTGIALTFANDTNYQDITPF